MKHFIITILAGLLIGCARMGSEIIHVTISHNGAVMNVSRSGVFVFGEVHQAVMWADGDTTGGGVVSHDKATMRVLGLAGIGAAAGGGVAGTPGALLGGAMGGGTGMATDSSK